MLWCCLHHITICIIFSLPPDNLFRLYHLLCCKFICWCLLFHLWYSWHCYCICQVDIILLITYHHILCILYLWCRLRPLCRLFQCLYLQIIHCYYLASPPHINLYRIWLLLGMRISSSIISCPGDHLKMGCLLSIIDWYSSVDTSYTLLITLWPIGNWPQMYLCIILSVYKDINYNPPVSFNAFNAIYGTLLLFMVFVFLT